jgi:hypothetical protein
LKGIREEQRRKSKRTTQRFREVGVSDITREIQSLQIVSLDSIFNPCPPEAIGHDVDSQLPKLSPLTTGQVSDFATNKMPLRHCSTPKFHESPGKQSHFKHIVQRSWYFKAAPDSALGSVISRDSPAVRRIHMDLF